MNKISSVAGLKSAIRLLEVEQASKGQQFKEQLSLVYENLKPINILKKTLAKVFSTQNLLDNFSGSAFGVVSGLLLKKLLIGKSSNTFKRLIGSFLQMSISNLVAQNSELIKSVGEGIINYLFRQKRKSFGNHIN